jgi:hypothetical protein
MELFQHLFKYRGKPRECVSDWPVVGPSGCTLTAGQQSRTQENVVAHVPWPLLTVSVQGVGGTTVSVFVIVTLG